MTEIGKRDKNALSLRVQKENAKRNGFFSGVFVLTLSAIVVKIIGLIYKIPMLKLLGSEGMGYFNSAFEIYSFFCVIATAGMPVAMSVLISSRGGDRGRAEAVLRVSRRLLLSVGAVLSALMALLAVPFATLLGSKNACFCIVAISPTVLFICLASAYRGYFQGMGRMLPTALSQTVEALGKLLLGLLLASFALERGMQTREVAAFAVLGLSLGVLASALCLLPIHRLEKEKSLMEKESGSILVPLLRIAVPVTLSSAVVSLTRVVDMTVILRRLQSLGEGSGRAFATYGNYTTLALPLFALAPALITSVAMPLIPALSRAVASGDGEGQRRSVADAMGLTAFVSMPVSVGLTMFAEPILNLLFAGESDAVAEAAPLLTLLGLSVTSSCLITVTNSILQAYGHATYPVLSMTVGAVLKVILLGALVGNPKVGILGAPISTFFCDLCVVAVNFLRIGKLMPTPPRLWDTVIKPFLAALVAVSVARVAYNAAEIRIGEGSAVSIACILLAAFLYLPIAGMRFAKPFFKKRLLGNITQR